MSGVVLSPAAEEALTLLASSIRVGRIRRGWTLAELAERVGVSRPTMMRVEAGSPGVAVGTVFEAARLVGVPLFSADPAERARLGAHQRAELALLPAEVRHRREVDDEF